MQGTKGNRYNWNPTIRSLVDRHGIDLTLGNNNPLTSTLPERLAKQGWGSHCTTSHEVLIRVSYLLTDGYSIAVIHGHLYDGTTDIGKSVVELFTGLLRDLPMGKTLVGNHSSQELKSWLLQSRCHALLFGFVGLLLVTTREAILMAIIVDAKVISLVITTRLTTLGTGTTTNQYRVVLSL